tara:strand:+ start:463 stop:837 length:375 start_codon:yes stop_codon:yes gene_type:complete
MSEPPTPKEIVNTLLDIAGKKEYEMDEMDELQLQRIGKMENMVDKELKALEVSDYNPDFEDMRRAMSNPPGLENCIPIVERFCAFYYFHMNRLKSYWERLFIIDSFKSKLKRMQTQLENIQDSK